MIIIVDFGSQFTQLVARRIRELNVYSKIIPYKNTETLSSYIGDLQRNNIEGIIFSGGPFSVYEKDAPKFLHDLLKIEVPILGICYGFQLINFLLGGKVAPAKRREYGFEKLCLDQSLKLNNRNPISSLKSSSDDSATIWMSHGDEVESLAPDLIIDSKTRSGVISSFHHKNKNIFGLQFHPEVEHTQCGKAILKHFVEITCKCQTNWNSYIQIEATLKSIHNRLKQDLKDDVSNSLHPQAICALSGGVDSCIAAVLCAKVFQKNLHCLFINNGLLRDNEFEEILDSFKKHLDLNVKGINASTLFLSKLSGISDAEEKRKIIGKTFIEVFEKEALKIPNAKYLIQGTLYPDVIESVPVYGSSVTIKTHHNVGGLPDKMSLKLIEPLRELFKDEVRRLGKELQVPDKFLNRHPFPGPGLAVRILGEITPQKLEVLRKADAILIEELKIQNLYNDVWQALVVLLPINSVGVMGDARTYENVAAIRCVSSVDGMTADWSKLPHAFLSRASSRITNEVKGINRVVYDITSKPPSTIEWE